MTPATREAGAMVSFAMSSGLGKAKEAVGGAVAPAQQAAQALQVELVTSADDAVEESAPEAALACRALPS